MIAEEHGLPLETPSPVKAGMVTFGAFFAAGMVPLLPYGWTVLVSEISHAFYISVAATLATFFAIGWMKGRIIKRSKWFAAMETLLIGSAAAGVAYFVGVGLRPLIE